MIRSILLTLATIALMASNANAILLSGQIQRIYHGADNSIGSSIDRYCFTANSTGNFIFDVRSWEVDVEDRHDGDSDIAEAVDLNGDGEFSFIDSSIYIFRNDGDLGLDDLLYENDDDFDNTYGDGSLFGYDSYLNVALDAGDYFFFIGAYYLTPEVVLAGINTDDFYPTLYSPLDESFSSTDFGSYVVTVTGDLTFNENCAQEEEPVVPEPATLGLIGIGLAGIAARARRRRAA